jgi:hypothetical protein
MAGKHGARGLHQRFIFGSERGGAWQVAHHA